MTGIEDLVAARGLALTRFADVLCGNAALAEDLVQSAFERTHLRWQRAGVADRPEAYVRQVIVREHLWRRRRRSSTEIVMAEPPEPPEPPERTNADDSARTDDRDQVWRQLATLPPQQRAVLVLRYYEDLDDAAIADVLGCAPGSVRSAASRAIATLRASSQLTRAHHVAGRVVPARGSLTAVSLGGPARSERAGARRSGHR